MIKRKPSIFTILGQAESHVHGHNIEFQRFRYPAIPFFSEFKPHLSVKPRPCCERFKKLSHITDHL